VRNYATLMGDRGSKEGNYDGTPIIKASGGSVVYVVGNYRVLKILRFDTGRC